MPAGSRRRARIVAFQVLFEADVSGRSLEHALELIASDECVEVTPKHIRLRKVYLDPHARVKAARAAS